MSHFMYLSVTGEDRIGIYRMDAGSGALELVENVAAGPGVMPLAVDPQQRFLYVGLRRVPQVQSYRLDGRTGGIQLLGSTPWTGTRRTWRRTTWAGSSCRLPTAAAVWAFTPSGMTVWSGRRRCAGMTQARARISL